MNRSETATSSSPASRRVLGTLGAVAAFAIAGGVWMHADQETALTLAGGVATASISAVPESSPDPSIPRASETALADRDDAAEDTPTF